MGRYWKTFPFWQLSCSLSPMLIDAPSTALLTQLLKSIFAAFGKLGSPESLPTLSWTNGYGSKLGTPKLWMVNTKLDIHICGPTSVFHFDPHPNQGLVLPCPSVSRAVGLPRHAQATRSSACAECGSHFCWKTCHFDVSKFGDISTFWYIFSWKNHILINLLIKLDVVWLNLCIFQVYHISSIPTPTPEKTPSKGWGTSQELEDGQRCAWT